jgi:D-sedoheptulose 7-phosphate isomerase
MASESRVVHLQRTCPAPAEFARGYIAYVAEVLAAIDPAEVAAFIATLLDARDRSATVYFIGNGGSAATASHFGNDLTIGTRTAERHFRVVSLTDNVAVMTAIANDFGYDQVFERQLNTVLDAGDVVVAISASGNSPNLIRAIHFAKRRGARTVGLTAFDGGELRKIVDVAVHVPTHRGEYGPAEDGHMVLDHLVTAYLMQAVGATPGS